MKVDHFFGVQEQLSAMVRYKTWIVTCWLAHEKNLLKPAYRMILLFKGQPFFYGELLFSVLF